jgi:hypothetical protein
LVVQFGDGTTFTRCIQGDGITGYDVLVRSGLEIIASFSNMGAAICKIGVDGCPAESCLVCQQPNYWSYWHLKGESWEYSRLGVSNYIVTAGNVEGWRWGQGAPPTVIPFNSICSQPATEMPQPTATQTQPTKTQPLPIPTDTPAPTATPMLRPPTETPLVILPTETMLPTIAEAAILPTVQDSGNAGPWVAILPLILREEEKAPTQPILKPTTMPTPAATFTPIALALANDIEEKTATSQIAVEIGSTGEAAEQPVTNPSRLPTQYLVFVTIVLLLTSILILTKVILRRK